MADNYFRAHRLRRGVKAARMGTRACDARATRGGPGRSAVRDPCLLGFFEADSLRSRGNRRVRLGRTTAAGAPLVLRNAKDALVVGVGQARLQIRQQAP